MSRTNLNLVLPGIRAYNGILHSYFFGRESALQRLLRAVSVYRLVFLYGKPESGKTSLLEAGLLPSLDKSRYIPVSIRLTSNSDRPIAVTNGLQWNSAGSDKESATRDDGSPAALSIDEFLTGFDSLLATRPDLVPVLVFDHLDQILSNARTTAAASRVLSALVHRADARVRMVFAFREEHFAPLRNSLDIPCHAPVFKFSLSVPSTEELIEIASRICRECLEKEGWIERGIADRLSASLIESPGTAPRTFLDLQILLSELVRSKGEIDQIVTRSGSELVQAYIMDSLEALPSRLRRAATALLEVLATQPDEPLTADSLVEATQSRYPSIPIEILLAALTGLVELTPLVANSSVAGESQFSLSRRGLVAAARSVGRKHLMMSAQGVTRRAYRTATIAIVAMVLVATLAGLALWQRTTEAVASEKVNEMKSLLMRAESERQSMLLERTQAEQERDSARVEMYYARARQESVQQELERVKAQLELTTRQLSITEEQLEQLRMQLESQPRRGNSSGAEAGPTEPERYSR